MTSNFQLPSEDRVRIAEIEARAKAYRRKYESMSFTGDDEADALADLRFLLVALPRLVARIRELEDDAARLDWFEANARWTLRDGWPAFAIDPSGIPLDCPPTIRAAIDAARLSQTEKPV